MQAIYAIGEIIQDYSADKLFHALGFGARLPPDGRVSHNFALNQSSKSPCHSIADIIAAYHQSLKTVQLYGPTNFAPVINHVAQLAQTEDTAANYFVLLIVTDGVVTDRAHTVEAITAASHLPISIIIIGVGDADFEGMNSLGVNAVRDIVQFVQFRYNTIKQDDS